MGQVAADVIDGKVAVHGVGEAESSESRSLARNRQEGRQRLATAMAFKARGKVIQNVTALLPTGCHHSQHSLHESAAMHTIGPAAYTPPDHCMAQRSCDRVVRRRDSLDACEAPKTFLDLEKLEARRRRLRARAPRPFLKGLLHLAPQAAHPLLKRTPRQRSIAYSVPVAEQPVRQRKQPLSNCLTVATPVDHCLKVSAEMSPADLSAGCLNPLIRAESVAADYLVLFAPQQSRGDFAATALGDCEDCAQAGHRGPQPSLEAILAPGRLVDIDYLGPMHRRREFVVRSFKGARRVPFQLGDHPGGDRKGKQVAYQLLDLSLAEAIGPREHIQHGLEVRAEASSRDTLRQRAAGRLAAARAGQAMEPILIDDRFDLGQFSDLMNQGFGVVASELLTASAASNRFTVDRLANLLGRYQSAVSLAMSWLPAAFPSSRWSWRLTLQPDRIRGRGLGRVGGVEFEPVLKIIDARFKLGNALFVDRNEREDRRLEFRRRRVP